MANRKGSGKDGGKCGICDRGVGERDQGVQCELCEGWFHAGCSKIPNEVYKVPEMLSRPGSPRPRPDQDQIGRDQDQDQDQTGRDRDRDQDQDQDLKKVVLIGLETKTRSRDVRNVVV